MIYELLIALIMPDRIRARSPVSTVGADGAGNYAAGAKMEERQKKSHPFFIRFQRRSGRLMMDKKCYKELGAENKLTFFPAKQQRLQRLEPAAAAGDKSRLDCSSSDKSLITL